MRKKALLALFFVGGVLNSQIPASGIDEKVPPTEVVIEQIADKSDMTPEHRVYQLLLITYSLLSGESIPDVGKHFSFLLTGNEDRLYNRHHTFKSTMANWTNFAANDFRSKFSKPIDAPPAESIALAKSTLQKAIVILQNSTDDFSKLSLYFVASRLLNKSGDTDNALKCENIVNSAIQSCEKENSEVADGQIEATASIFNAMAAAILPVPMLPSQDRNYPAPVSKDSFTEDDFKKSETLKLRSLAIIDRLPSTNHERRLAHRNMVLWYIALSKADKADKEKQILFNLVGTYNDNILFPFSLGCGNVVWWVAQAHDSGMLCGMG